MTVVDGDDRAFKITTPADLDHARSLVASASVSVPLPASASTRLARPLAPRVGVGTDVHAFSDGGTLWLAGLEWPGEPALAGHSDGDAVAHAIVDALLSERRPEPARVTRMEAARPVRRRRAVAGRPVPPQQLAVGAQEA